MNQTSNDEMPLERGDVGVRLDEGVLHGLVGLGHVAQIVPGDARRPALLTGNDLRKHVARRVVVARGEEVLDLSGQRRFDIRGTSRARRGERVLAAGSLCRS